MPLPILPVLSAALRVVVCAGILCLPPSWSHTLDRIGARVASEGQADLGGRLVDWGQDALHYTFSGVVRVGGTGGVAAPGGSAGRRCDRMA
ncbi:MAG: hypothetical protein ACXIUZ_06975 [Lysobacteraceae bacterium]